ncbi:uncharacterized protein LOC142803181 [Rhipicephalus microplus]|uniref:uncharacterized protein LOC142803181 n=1 Tax=Rhipicephalus microplus TaxID=6941 RepID=UPI003F6D11EC
MAHSGPDGPAASLQRHDDTTEGIPPQNERKFIVFESSLKELLSTCRKCFAACKTASSVYGTLLQVQTVCTNNHVLSWKSQPLINGKPAGNVLMSAGILFSGTSHITVLRMFEHINLQVFMPRTFFNYQRAYLLPAIDKIWHQQQNKLFRQLHGCSVDLAGDGRCDSPGFSAKFMTYSLHVTQVNKILHFEQVQVGECADVKSSTSMEKHAFVKCLDLVKKRGLRVTSVTTDRHVQVTKYSRTQEPTIPHFYDAWHISKGTPAHKKFANAVMAPRLLKDIRQLAPSTHTFSLEASQSVLIGFAAKSVCFSSDGMRARGPPV